MSIKTENIDSHNSNNNDFILKQMKAIKELNESEKFLDTKILNSKIKKNESFQLFDKNWLEKWKSIVGYDQIKDKLVKCKEDKDYNEKIPEVSEIFEKLNTKQKLEELGQMDCSNFIRTSGNKKFINFDGNFVPILAHQCAYFAHAIKNKFQINSEIYNGIIFIHDPFPEKNKEQKLILLYKEEGKSNDFIRPVITLEPKENIKNVIKKLKDKKIEEILNQKEYKLDIVKPKEIDTNKEEEEKKKKEEERKKKEEERKKKEDEEKKKMEMEKKKKEEEERKRKEDEEKKKKDEEEKKKKEEEDRKKREQEEADKKKREKEEADKKRREQEEREQKEEADKKKKEEEEQKRKDEEEKKRKEEEEKKKKEKDDKKRKEEEDRKKKEEDEKKQKEEEDRKKKEEADKKKKEEEEEKKRKQEEEEEKRKQEEEERKRKEEEDKKRKEEEEKKKKEEEEKKKKEEAEKKKKEEEEKKKKEEEEKRKKEEEKKRKKLEEEKIRKQKEDIEKEKAQKDKEQKERERPVNKNFEILDAMKKQVSFDENIKNKEGIENENFLLSCSIINKQWYDEFLKLSNFDSFKENIAKSPNDAGQIFQNSINDKKIDINELTTFIQKKPENLKPQALDKIENLAFVDDEFAAKILSLGNINNSNNNQINNNANQIPIQQQLPKAKIMMNKGAAVIQLNDNKQKIITGNIQNSNLNKINNIQVLDFPKDNKIDIFQQIVKNPKNGLIQNVRDEYISSLPKKKIDNPKPINNILTPKKKDKKEVTPQKPRITLDGQDCSLGLDNVGATCYMNATLQCLAHLKRITEHIINYREEGIIKDQKKYKLSEAYSEVVNAIWRPGDKTKRSYPPNRFKRVLGEMNSLFAKFEANDAKDLLIYFIEQMHTELNKSTETNLNLVMPDDMNPMDHQQVLECFVNEFMKKYNSVFSHYCYGSNVSVTLCNGCRVQKFSYQCFSFIIFPLLEAKKNCVLTGKLNPMFYNNYILNIEDCFQYNQKIEFFTGNNQMYCNICQASRDSSMQSRISAAPLVLILILNRGKGNLDFREPFIFWETIDIRNYVEFPQPDNKYFLCGVVSHMGDSGPSGHFIAYCRMSESQKWYCYNDSLVNESSFQEINTRGTPYILFYQKIQMVA